ncbi:MAG: HEPN domain-containing protein, partial [Flavobacteriia bacterium]
FREGIENLNSTSKKAIVEKDIIELGQKIQAFKEGILAEDKFKALRLARGVYGQRQQGVQMIRIKLPFGKVTPTQLRRICEVSDEYSTGKLHITTRQDIQIHYVSLDRTPQLWADLEKDDITLREACGNTVRNVTASAIAGIDKNEPFDVAPYADLIYRYFLRKPFGQELGRKIKIAFSSSEEDDSYTFIHDFGFIPKIKNDNGIELKGFKVLVGGGLGAQPFLAHTAFEFLPASEIIPFMEASIRIFDRYGERNSRNKARMKYLIGKLGIDEFIRLVQLEAKAVQYNPEVDFILFEQQLDLQTPENASSIETILSQSNDLSLNEWLKTNVIEQKQPGYYAVYVKVQLGDFTTEQARLLATITEKYASDDIRFTIDQSLLLKFVKGQDLVELYIALKAIGLGDSGYNSLADVTACPGTDTCNLGISNSTTVAKVIEDLIRAEYPELVYEQSIKIKISGCMNSCGQHGLAHIGFHGSSMKVEKSTLPALQVLLGGGKSGDGAGRIAEKVIKLPSKRVLDIIRTLLNDFLENQRDENFNEYYDRQGNKYFYDLLKPLADLNTIKDEDFIDWGNEDKFKTEIGVGECAGVIIDLVATLIYDAEEKLNNAKATFESGSFADSLYHSYSAGIHAAKAILIENKVHCNTHAGIIADFDKHLATQFGFDEENTFADFIQQINKEKASQSFANEFHQKVDRFVNEVSEKTKKQKEN